MVEELINEPGRSNHNAAQQSAQERRQHTRYPFTATVEAVDTASETRIQGRTSDLSRGGCYVDTISSFPAGSTVKIRLTKENRSFDAQAEVVYSMTGMGMGVRFTEVGPDQLSTVEKWLGELSGELQPEAELPVVAEEPREETKPASQDYEVLSEVLNELLVELMRQGVLPNGKCEALFRKLNRGVASKSNSVSARK
jgi:hypothetical protein